MRRVESPGDLAPALAEAMREAQSAFGDPRMFLEQAVQRPRHIEVQVLADSTGHTVHRSEEHTSELQSLMRISYAVFCLKTKNSAQQEHISVVASTQTDAYMDSNKQL